MRRFWLIAAAVALIGLGVAAYVLIAPRSHVLSPPRATNGVDYVLYVHVPQACRVGGCRAAYLLDGLAWLPTFARISDGLHSQRRIEPLILIGVGYRNAINTGALRKHDFTPAFGRTPNQTGGADAFLDVLRAEIIPYAEAHLPINSDQRTLIGHSYAGLFASYTLAKTPDFFDRYLIMSPALWFDDGEIFDEQFAPAEHERTVFLAADTPRGEARSDMARDTLRLNALLLQHPDLSVSHTLLVGETHNSMVEPAAQRGLLALYSNEH